MAENSSPNSVSSQNPNSGSTTTPTPAPDPQGWFFDDSGNKSSMRLMCFICLLAAIGFIAFIAYMGCLEKKFTQSIATQYVNLAEARKNCNTSPADPAPNCLSILKEAQVLLEKAQATQDQSKGDTTVDGLQNMIFILLLSAFAPKVWQKFAENDVFMARFGIKKTS